MYRPLFLHITFALITIIIAVPAIAQEANTPVYYSKKYIDLNLKSLTKVDRYTQKQQTKLLKKLKRKEVRFAHKLKRNDSAAYQQYVQSQITYDSISRIQKPDSITLSRKTSTKSNAAIDSLKGVQRFLQDKSTAGIAPDYNHQINDLNSNQQYRSYVDDLITQRTNNLKYLASSTKGKVGGLSGIEKNVFYSNQKIRSVKDAANDPSKAEAFAMEFLMGEKGFNDYMQPPAAPNTARMTSGMSVGDLEKMGFQTKRQISTKLQTRFGDNIGRLQDNVSSQIDDYKNKVQEIKNVKNNAIQAKQSAKNIRNINAPSFRVNPMRGQPFWQRIEKQYNWNTTRATLNGKPAILNLSLMAGYKHTPNLTYGVGLAASFGLGQNWNNIHFSFEGISLRTFAEWEIIYGISFYAGYERKLKEAFLDNKNNTKPAYIESFKNKKYYDAILIGLSKRYHINDKWNGSFQVLYDVWWREKGLRSPIQLRLSTIKQ